MPDFEKLNDTNYIDWSCLMEAHLTRKELWEVVDGTESKPTGSVNSKLMKTWTKRQRLAHAEIILHVETDQLLHTCFDDPKEIWENLEKIHHARSFATHLLLRWRFLSIKKDPTKPMSHWIAAVKQVAYQLMEIGATTTDENIIIALTLSLPASYDNFVIMLDSTPPNQLTLDYAIVHLLNEASRQELQDVEHGLAPPSIRRIKCHGCGKCGHIKANCTQCNSDSDSDSQSRKCKACGHIASALSAGDEFAV
jgi:hypothetical protein